MRQPLGLRRGGERRAHVGRRSRRKLSASSTPEPATARAWCSHAESLEPTTHNRETYWPELGDPAVAARENVGVCFSGGSSRAFVAALGQLAALSHLGILPRLRYFAGVSGGAWATAAYCYAQRGQRGVASTDEELLGHILPPDQLDWTRLDSLPPLSARRLVSDLSIAGSFGGKLASGLAPFPAWREALERCLLEPLGIPPGAPFTWSKATAREIERRNPALKASRFVSCGGSLGSRGDGSCCTPYPLIGSTLLGPTNLAPFSLASRAYVFLESTPLYVGVSHPLRVNYTAVGGGAAVAGKRRSKQSVLLGGLVEPFAFGAPTASRVPCSGSQNDTRWKSARSRAVTLRLPALRTPLFSLGDAIGASSYFAGATLSSTKDDHPDQASGDMAYAPRDSGSQEMAVSFGRGPFGSSPLAQPLRHLTRPLRCLTEARRTIGRAVAPWIGPSVSYWTPLAAEPSPVNMLLGDGGALTNPPLISLLQRRVPRLLVFLNVGDPLPPASEWDPFRAPTHPSFSDDLPPFFGIVPQEWGARSSKWTQRNAVFPTSDFAPLVAALQAAQAEGRGAVVTSTHTTVANRWWGVKAGQKVTITWSYLVECPTWEARLPAEVQRAIPKRTAALQA